MDPLKNYDSVVLETFPEEEFISIFDKAFNKLNLSNNKNKLITDTDINQSMFRYPIENLNPYYLSLNTDERILEFFELHPKYIDITELSTNKNEVIIEFLINRLLKNSDGTYNLDKMTFVNWPSFFRNPTNIVCDFINKLYEIFPNIINIMPYAICHNINPKISHIIKQYINKFGLKKYKQFNNPSEELIDTIIKKYKHNINIYTFINNSHPKAINYITEELNKLQEEFITEPTKIDFIYYPVSFLKYYKNENIIDLLNKYTCITTNTDFFKFLSMNTTIKAYEIISEEIEKQKLENPENEPTILNKLDWYYISANPLYTNLLMEYPNRITFYIFINPSLIIIEYLKDARINKTINNFEDFLKHGLYYLLQNRNTDAFSILSDEEIEELFKDANYSKTILQSRILFSVSEPYVLK